MKKKNYVYDNFIKILIINHKCDNNQEWKIKKGIKRD